jgi:hypothetical protein
MVLTETELYANLILLIAEGGKVLTFVKCTRRRLFILYSFCLSFYSILSVYLYSLPMFSFKSTFRTFKILDLRNVDFNSVITALSKHLFHVCPIRMVFGKAIPSNINTITIFLATKLCLQSISSSCHGKINSEWLWLLAICCALVVSSCLTEHIVHSELNQLKFANFLLYVLTRSFQSYMVNS